MSLYYAVERIYGTYRPVIGYAFETPEAREAFVATSPTPFTTGVGFRSAVTAYSARKLGCVGRSCAEWQENARQWLAERDHREMCECDEFDRAEESRLPR